MYKKNYENNQMDRNTYFDLYRYRNDLIHDLFTSYLEKDEGDKHSKI